MLTDGPEVAELFHREDALADKVLQTGQKLLRCGLLWLKQILTFSSFNFQVNAMINKFAVL